MVTCTGSTRYLNYLEDYWPSADGLSTVNVNGTQLRDPKTWDWPDGLWQYKQMDAAAEIGRNPLRSSTIFSLSCCCCCCCFSHSAHWLPTRKKLLYTVANPARGLLNREKKEKEKVWQRTPPPPPPRALLVRRKKKKKKKKN